MEIKYSKIKSIKEVKIDKTYDFEVKNKHRIIAKDHKSENAFYTSNCWHPDVEEFITSKQTPGRLTKFNMSVLITDDFMKAVNNNQPWNLEFPNYEKHPNEYKEFWNGDIKKWKSMGFATEIYKTYEDANELWDIIMTSTYNRNEPGVLFVDTINKLNNLNYCEFINATNPCGEQVLPISGVCLLGSINLTQFVDFNKKDWDYDKLAKLIPIAIRMMDNVNDKTYVPLESQQENLKDKRRIGLGLMGYGSVMMMLKLRYGSKKAIKMTDKLMSFIANTAYQASSLLALEKGSFPLYNEEEYLNSNYIKTALSKETQDMIRKNGIRNSHLLSIQPTGNSSVFANNVSGGLEPVFMSEYYRTTIMPYAPVGLDKPKNVDWENKSYESSTKWNWAKEGDENILITNFSDHVWKFDKSRGLLRENKVIDYGVRFLESKGEWNPEADWAATTTQLTIDEHVNTMAVMAKYIDSAISKTINIPFEYPFEDFKRLYMEMYKTGVIKGGTTYRAGTMLNVLSDKSTSEGEQKGIIKHDAPKRPRTLDCDIHQLTVMGEKWMVLVGLYDGDPYEVFAFKKKSINLSEKIKSGKLTRIKSGRYDLELEMFTMENIKEHFESTEHEAFTRMISTNLRHGVDISFIYDQLMKSEGNIVSFAKAVARSLKKYVSDNKLKVELCPKCEANGLSIQLTRKEGCVSCTNCGYSVC